ncbi:MAG: site-specific DNA-methyltransferase [bacterium]
MTNLKDNFKLINGDTFKKLKTVEEKSIDMIFSDPPYFLSSGGISCSGGKQVNVNKGEWDYSLEINERLKYHRKWIKLCRNVLKDDGTIWISATLHSVYTIGVALELEGFSIINNIIWKKTNPPPNLACRCFTHSTETVIWARKQLTPKKKGKHCFNYQDMKQENYNKQMKDVWEFEDDCIYESSLTPQKEKKEGKHPTQKPLALLERIIKCSSLEGQTILDPFNGSGTTGVAALKLNRKYIGIDISKEYIELTKRRISKLEE